MKIGPWQISGHAAAGAGISIGGVVTVVLSALHFIQSSCPNLPSGWVTVIGGVITALGFLVTFTAHPPQKVSPP